MYKMRNLSHQTFAFYTCSLSHFRTFAFYNFPTLRLQDITPTVQFAYCLDILPIYFLQCEVIIYALKCNRIVARIVLSPY